MKKEWYELRDDELKIVLTVAQAGAIAYVPIPNADGLDACWSEEDFNDALSKIRDALKFHDLHGSAPK